MPTWVSEVVARAIHSQLLTEHGGLQGHSRTGALEAALARPQNLLGYAQPEPTLAKLAAAYGFALACGHCFPDGNKRLALAVIDNFLQLNGYELTAADSPETVVMIAAVAGGEMSEEQLAEWIQTNCQPLDQPL